MLISYLRQNSPYFCAMKKLQRIFIAFILLCYADLYAQQHWTYLLSSENDDKVYLARPKKLASGKFRVWVKFESSNHGASEMEIDPEHDTPEQMAQKARANAEAI